MRFKWKDNERKIGLNLLAEWWETHTANSDRVAIWCSALQKPPLATPWKDQGRNHRAQIRAEGSTVSSEAGEPPPPTLLRAGLPWSRSPVELASRAPLWRRGHAHPLTRILLLGQCGSVSTPLQSAPAKMGLASWSWLLFPKGLGVVPGTQWAFNKHFLDKWNLEAQ